MTTTKGPLLSVSGPSPASIAAARAAILAILQAPHADQKTKRAALAAFNYVCSVESTTIHSCTFTSK